MNALDLKYEASKAAERARRWLVWRLPRRLVMWCAIRVIANATTGQYENTIVPDLTAVDALGRWDNNQEGRRR